MPQQRPSMVLPGAQVWNPWAAPSMLPLQPIARPIGMPPVAAAFNPQARQSSPILGALGQVYNQLFSKDPARGGDETAPAYVMRRLLSGQTGPGQAGARAADAVGADLKKFVSEITSTPNNPAGIFGAAWTPTPGQGPGAARDGGKRAHTGRDYSGLPVGTPIQAPMSGVVQEVGERGANGKFVKVKWQDGSTSTIAHLAAVANGLKPGFSIPAGATFAQAGNSGNASTAGTDRAVLHVTQRDPQGNVIDPASWLGRMGQMAATFGAPAPAFNPAPFQNAMAAQDQAAAMLMQPTSATFTETPLPARPQLEEFQAPDFAAGDAAFAASAPTNPFDDPKEKVRVQRTQWLKGIGQAIASLSGNEGIGTMLMKMGAGSLIGRAAGDEMIDEKEAEFERNMQLYNRALANREDNKAAQIATVMHSNIQQRNQRADQIWADAVTQIKAKQPVFDGKNLVTYERDPSNPNKWTATVKPLGNAIAAEALLNKANIGIQMGQAATAAGQFAYSHEQAAARTSLGLVSQMALSQGAGANGAGEEGFLIEATNRARASVKYGTWRGLLGNDVDNIGDGLDQIAKKRAYEALGVRLSPDGTPLMPLNSAAQNAFNEMYENNLTANITEYIAKTAGVKGLTRLFSHPVSSFAYTAQRGANQRETERVDARGRVSRSTSWDMSD